MGFSQKQKDNSIANLAYLPYCYYFTGHLIHEEYEDGDVMTLPPPPPPPRPVPTMLVEPTPEILTQAPPPPPRHQPTMMVEPTDYYHTPEVTHNIGNINTVYLRI